MRIRRLICGHSYRCGTDAACLPFHFHQLYSITTSYAAYSVYRHIATPYSDLKSNKTSASYIFMQDSITSKSLYGIVSAKRERFCFCFFSFKISNFLIFYKSEMSSTHCFLRTENRSICLLTLSRAKPIITVYMLCKKKRVARYRKT